ncbi:hypothetical protein K1719_037889 [Acacia pycnantha]|nr:hypothetical protein K1719_037889 [Acacia pycnantha]
MGEKIKTAGYEMITEKGARFWGHIDELFGYLVLIAKPCVRLIAFSLSRVCPVPLSVCGHHYQPLPSTSEEAIMLVPPWLEPLLSTAFFTICQTHISLPRNECNMFCIDCCLRSAFCFYCRSIWHQHHQVIQIRRSSYHDVVRVSEIDKVLDISGVQTYVINSAKVIFLNERPQPKTSYSGKSSPHFCKICTRSLLDPFCFCSLGCKLVGIKKNKESNKVGSEERRRLLMGPSKEEKDEFEEGNGNKESNESSKQNGRLLRPLQQAYSNSRRRKGIPQRAPLGP